MSRHVNDIKNMLFDQPEFESDNDDDDQKDFEPIMKKKSTVETIDRKSTRLNSSH